MKNVKLIKINRPGAEQYWAINRFSTVIGFINIQKGCIWAYCPDDWRENLVYRATFTADEKDDCIYQAKCAIADWETENGHTVKRNRRKKIPLSRRYPDFPMYFSAFAAGFSILALAIKLITNCSCN